MSEDVAPSGPGARWAPTVGLPQRVLAQLQLLEKGVAGRKLDWKDVPVAEAPQGRQERLARGAQEISVTSRMPPGIEQSSESVIVI